MNVLHVASAYFPSRTGYSFRTRALCLASIKHGIKPFVIVGPHFYNEPVESEFEVYRIPPSPQKLIIRQPHVLLRFSKAIEELCKNKNINIIHSHTPSICGVAGLIASKRLGIKWIHEMRGLPEESWRINWKISRLSPPYLEEKIGNELILRSCKKIICISNSLKTYWVQRGFSKSKIDVIPNGVDATYFNPTIDGTQIKEKLGLHENYVLLYAGDLRRLEGLEYVIKALPIVLNAVKNVKFIILKGGLGGSEYESYLLKLANDLGVNEKVSILNSVEHADIPRYIAASDLYLLPRLKNIVSDLVTPLKPYEPMAMEKVVLASDLSSMREIIKDGTTGILFKPEDEKDIAEEVLNMLTDNKKRILIGRNARKWIVENRNWDLIGEKLKHIYDEVIDEY